MDTLWNILKDEGAIYIDRACYWIEDGRIMCETSDGMLLDCDFMADEELIKWNNEWIFKD